MPAGDVIFPLQVAQLVQQGRRRGAIRTEDLRRELPIQLMTPEELAIILTHLESEGIEVDLDEALFSPQRSPQLSSLPPETTLLPPEPDRPAPAALVAPRAPASGMTAASSRVGGSFSAHFAVAVGGALSLGLLFLYFVAWSG